MPTVGIARWAWTEPLFTVVVLLSLFLLDRIRRRPGDTVTSHDIIVLVLLTWMAALLRYAGLALLPGVAASLVIIQRGKAGAWLRPASIYLAVASTVPLLWFSRNLVLIGAIGGPGTEPRDSVVSNLMQVTYTVGQTLMSRDLGPRVLGVIGLVTLLWLGWAHVQDLRSRLVTGGRATIADVLVAISSGVVLTLLLAARITWVAINWRMLAPLFPLLVVMIAITLDRTSRRSPGRAVGVGGLVAVVLVSTATTTTSTLAAGTAGLGFNTARWEGSPLVAAVDELPASVTLASNNGNAVWATTRRRPILRAPLLDTTSASGGDDLAHEAVRTALCDPKRDVVLVWFGSEPRRWDRTGLPAVAVESEPLLRTEDGALFRLRSHGLPVGWCGTATAAATETSTPRTPPTLRRPAGRPSHRATTTEQR